MAEEKFTYDFEKLEVYNKSLEFTDDIYKTTSKFKKELQFSLGDQIRRAALSICNNIAEGSGKHGKAKLQFYDYSMNSCRECVPMISICLRQGQIDGPMEQKLRNQCITISKMLYRLIQSVTP